MSSPNLDETGRTYRGAGPQQRQDERRARLVYAAVEVFGTTGYRSATVEKICAAAGLTKRYFYESFGDKEALLLAAYTHATDALRDSIVAGTAVDAPDVDTQTHRALDAFFTTIADDPRLARIAFLEILGVNGDIDRAYRRVTETFVDTVLVLAEPALRRGSLPEARQRTMATGMVGAVLMIAQQWVLADYPQPIDAVVASSHSILTAVFGQLAQ